MSPLCDHLHCCAGLRLSADGLVAVLVCDDCCKDGEFLRVLPGITADVREKFHDAPASRAGPAPAARAAA